MAWHIRRPFHSQAVALVSACYTLVTEWKLEENRSQENLILLRECVGRPLAILVLAYYSCAIVMDRALNATLRGLEEALKTVTELKIFNLEDLEFHPAYQALEKAHAPIKTCHDRLFEVRLSLAASALG